MGATNEETSRAKVPLMRSMLAKILLVLCAGVLFTGIVLIVIAATELKGNVADGALVNRAVAQMILAGVIIFAIVLVIGITAGIRKLSAATATALFIAYSLINGVTMSFIFLAYTQASIVSAFAVTAGTFGVMAVSGSVTKRDLTGLGSLFLMALIGIIIASIVNIFWMNDTFGLIISCVGVIVFVGLTAYDAQKVKKMFLESGMESSEVVRKIAILGALSLYLDFINLFLFILRIFGRRR